MLVFNFALDHHTKSSAYCLPILYSESKEKMFYLVTSCKWSINQNIKEGLDDFSNSKRQMLMCFRRNLTSDPGIKHTEVIHLDSLVSPCVTYFIALLSLLYLSQKQWTLISTRVEFRAVCLRHFAWGRAVWPLLANVLWVKVWPDTSGLGWILSAPDRGCSRVIFLMMESLWAWVPEWLCAVASLLVMQWTWSMRGKLSFVLLSSCSIALPEW